MLDIIATLVAGRSGPGDRKGSGVIFGRSGIFFFSIFSVRVDGFDFRQFRRFFLCVFW